MNREKKKTTTNLRKSSFKKDRLNQDCTRKLKQFMTSTPFSIFMSALTIYTIFAIDIDKGFFNRNASIFFSSVHVISMLIFVLQIIFMSKTQKDYLFQFYFWIDVFSTLTMVLQIIWIEDLMSSVSNVQMAISFARVSKASRFSKIGARSTKIMKLIRLIKLMKLMKKQEQNEQENHQQQIFPQITESQNKNISKLDEKQSIDQNKQKQFISLGTQKNNEAVKDQKADQLKSRIAKVKRYNVNPQKQKQIQHKWQLQSQDIVNKNSPVQVEQQEKGTKVGEILKYEIQKNIVIMVMALIIIVPILGADTWFTKSMQLELSTQYYLDIVKKSDQNTNQTFAKGWLNNFIQLSKQAGSPTVYFQFDSAQPYSSNTTPIQILRQSEKTVIKNEENTYKIIYSKKNQVQITSWINMSRSVFITLVLLFSSIFFVKDLENYALSPLQKMNETVQKIQKNPFASLQTYKQQDNQQELIEESKQNQELELQTNVLQKLLIKIAGLLALGVGQTPSKLTSNEIDGNMNNLNSLEDESSVEIEGVFMVMHVAHMNKIIQILEGQASCYINCLIQIFHEVIIQNGGFVYHQDESYTTVCWKLNPTITGPSQKLMQIKIEEKKKTQLALQAYLKFCQRVSQDPQLKKYQYLSSFIHNFQVSKFHIGIHSGTAFCGTIGSQFKISLRALGSDISITRTLCRAAQKFQLSNCISTNVYKQAPFIHSLCRKIDQISILQLTKDSEHFQVYSLYVHYENFNNYYSNIKFIQNSEINQFKLQRKINKLFKSRDNIINNNSKAKIQEFTAISKFLLKKYPNVQQWLQNWRQSQNKYETGQWNLAQTGFTNIKEFSTQFADFILEIRQKEVSQRQQPPFMWKKQKNFSLFL